MVYIRALSHHSQQVGVQALEETEKLLQNNDMSCAWPHSEPRATRRLTWDSLAGRGPSASSQKRCSSLCLVYVHQGLGAMPSALNLSSSPQQPCQVPTTIHSPQRAGSEVTSQVTELALTWPFETPVCSLKPRTPHQHCGFSPPGLFSPRSPVASLPLTPVGKCWLSSYLT